MANRRLTAALNADLHGLSGPFYNEAIPPAGFYGMGDVPSDYGVPYAGHVHQPYAATGPMGSLGGLPEMVATFQALSPVAKIALLAGAVYLGRKLLK